MNTTRLVTAIVAAAGIALASTGPANATDRRDPGGTPESTSRQWRGS